MLPTDLQLQTSGRYSRLGHALQDLRQVNYGTGVVFIALFAFQLRYQHHFDHSLSVVGIVHLIVLGLRIVLSGLLRLQRWQLNRVFDTELAEATVRMNIHAPSIGLKQQRKIRLQLFAKALTERKARPWPPSIFAEWHSSLDYAQLLKAQRQS